MRISNLVLLAGLAILLAACCTPNLAQGAEPATTGIDSAAELKKANAKATAANNNWAKQTTAWKKTLDAGQARQMKLLVTLAANNYDVAHTAFIMEEAKKSCVKANPPLAQGLEQAWGIWSQEVANTMNDATARADNLLNYQTIGAKADVKNYLLAFRRAKGTQDALVEIIPVTSEKDCTKLQKTLGKTGEDLAAELREATRQVELDFKDVLENPPVTKTPVSANQ